MAGFILTAILGLLTSRLPRLRRSRPFRMTRVSLHNGSEPKPVFSDEFNNDGWTFYPGDDPIRKLSTSVAGYNGQP